MFNIATAWIYGTEIWLQEIRAKGYSFTLFGWATGCGTTQLVVPVLLNKLGQATFIFFGALTIVEFPIVWLTFSEIANRSFEKVSLLFTNKAFSCRRIW